jgi:putative tryptophan/tyrosine transport system substrate-binding protein
MLNLSSSGCDPQPTLAPKLSSKFAVIRNADFLKRRGKSEVHSGRAHMRRREFITLVGGAAGWPVMSRAQQSKRFVIGYLSSISNEPEVLAGFRKGLADLGFIEGQNVTVIYRYANGQYERLPALVAELIAEQVDVIVTEPSSPAALAAKRTTSTIPIVFYIGVDPVGLGLISSYNRPGANVTGINVAPESLTAKRFELLNEFVPKHVLLAELLNPNNKAFLTSEVKSVEEAAGMLGREVVFVNASTEAEIANGFEEIARKHVGGLVVSLEAVFEKSRVQIVSLANRYNVPAVYPTRQFTELGGLLSYGPNISAAHRQVGYYTGEILKGTHPADLPVMTPIKYDLVINLKTAKLLGIDVPSSLLATADEVIE